MNKDFDVVSKTYHDQTAKQGLKDREVFEDCVHFGCPKKAKFFDFSRFQFINAEFFQKHLGGKVQTRRGDVMALVGVKETDKKVLLGIITEHKSHSESSKEIYLQLARANMGLLEMGIYPGLTLIVSHANAPMHIAPDLQGAFGWTPAMREVLGDSALNFAPDVLNLRKKSDDEIIKGAGKASALCYALKNIWGMTQEKIKLMFNLCFMNSHNVASYKRYANILADYVLQGTSYSVEDLEDMEKSVIINEEDRIMPSTYERIIEEGLQKGLQKGRQEGLQEGRQEGLQEGIKTVAYKLLQQSLEIPSICKATGLSKEQVLALKKDFKPSS